jgi:hypothetical protein
MEKDLGRSEPETQDGKKPYEPPKVVVVDEKEMLKVFQVTSAGSSWWG